MSEFIKLILLVIIFVLLIMTSVFIMNKEENKVVSNSQNIISENIENKIENEFISNNVIDSEIKGEENMSDVVTITNDNFEEEVLNYKGKVLVDFYADWCVPCQMLSPIVEKVSSEVDNVKVVKVNVDEVNSVAVEYGVMSIPTLVVIENGKEVDRSVGLIEENRVKELIK